jgi:prepilin-type N-terminal cleavage/methylation domain-containing protein
MQTECLKRQGAFTLVEIMIVVAIIGILVAIAIPGFIKAREESQATACKESQVKFSGARMQYAMEQNTLDKPSMTDLVGTTLYIRQTPRCPTENKAMEIPDSHQKEVECPSEINDHNRE